MRAYLAFFKKELMDYSRSGKMLFLGILFVLFGIMNPAIAKLTPWLMELMAEELAQSGMTIAAVEPDALMSWTQFFKNIPMALIVFVLIVSNCLTKEYTGGTLVLMLTKGLARYKVYLAKATAALLLWSLGYFTCFAITYGYTVYFWDHSTVQNLIPAVLYWYVFGVLCICLSLVFSTVYQSNVAVAVTTGGAVLLSTLLGMLPKLADAVPTALLNSGTLLTGAQSPATYTPALILSASLSVVALILGIPLFNRKTI